LDGERYRLLNTGEDRQSSVPVQALEMAVRDGKFEEEGWCVRKDGGRFRALMVIDPIRLPFENLVGFTKITRELSERKLAEIATRQSEEPFRLLVQAVSDYAINMLDPEGRVSNRDLGAQKIKVYQHREYPTQPANKLHQRASPNPQHAGNPLQPPFGAQVARKIPVACHQRWIENNGTDRTA
jgi:PAS domain-containing protein